MQFLYTFYLYINTGDIKGIMMFLSTFQNSISFSSNPFAMGLMSMNPRMDFFMGMAAATSPVAFGGSVFNYVSPVMNFGYNNPFVFTPNFGGFGMLPQMPVMPTLPQITFPTVSMLPIPQLMPIPIPSFGSITVSSSRKVEPQGATLSKNKNQYGPEFLNKVKDISKRLNCNYRDLLAVMNAESGINAQAKNKSGSATGLIQFIESTAESLGTSTAALRNMSPVEQLDYVEKYLTRAKATAGFASGEAISGGQLYALVFAPARAKRDVLASRSEAAYAAGGNSRMDLNKDGKITKDELDARVRKFYVSDNSFLA